MLIKTQLKEIPGGIAGVRATLDEMSRLVNQGKRDYSIRSVALRLVRSLPQKAFASEVRRLYTFVRDRIRYVRDINGIETLQTPRNTLRIGQGDCDDKAVLLAALLESIGHPTRFVAIATKKNNYSHVFVETKIGSRWVALETTEPWEAGDTPDSVQRMVRHN